MKETIIGVICLAVALWAYVNMPLEWRRHKDISFANQLITAVENYQTQNHKLPETQDEKTLLQLGFRKNKLGWQPNYQKINDLQFKIVYADGYAPPHLTWDNQNRVWQLLNAETTSSQTTK